MNSPIIPIRRLRLLESLHLIDSEGTRLVSGLKTHTEMASCWAKEQAIGIEGIVSGVG